MTDDQALTGTCGPHPFVWSNFTTVFDQIDVWRYTWNTFLYAGLSTVGVVCSCVPVAYAFVADRLARPQHRVPAACSRR